MIENNSESKCDDCGANPSELHNEFCRHRLKVDPESGFPQTTRCALCPEDAEPGKSMSIANPVPLCAECYAWYKTDPVIV